ncbi:MAG: hypothetical protein A2Z99_09395 [Treponema sp. GWB1_62_6]|nr:MAG: hypothetical protein A2Y36_07005 [Treponema sp. GWA1_62_8]OHE66209.1 MAG: hypothetical protein A2Z99_09395 [Treponema sp. GWB1_62_6]OHE67433.1 MAG: hypothetical protein A2001_07470 [Treponema sp. GWC1_61_84]OHE76773.1 MAG: hypothetical protein A2413_00135 [Treponema sp. RIFOXYC1_FULL_61_9]HCM28373.1 hypothetical protein [Treponema sp.]
MGEALYYKEDGGKLYLKAQGHISAALCADLRSLVFERFDKVPAVTAMFVDLSLCDYMDSTFMGLLVGFNKRLARCGGKRLAIVAPTATAAELLSGLGLTSLVEIVKEENFPEDMENIVKTRTASSDLLMKAHENLMELSEANKKRFATLHSVLKGQSESGKDS